MDIYLRPGGVMEGEIMKKRRVLAIIIGLCLMLGLAVVSFSVLPYNGETNWSALYFEADLENIYNQSLDELKSAYEEITTLDYYEINSQFLEITYPKVKDEFLYGFEYGNAEKQVVGKETIYQTKCFQISKNCFDKFDIEVSTGRTFSDEDMEYRPGKNIPIIVGYEYADELEIGDVNGGKNGQDSIRNGLLDIQSRHPEDDTIVLVHDAIRPMLSQEIISENIRVCREKGNAITVVPCTAAMLKTYDSECSEEQVPRDNLKITQTPQTFFLNEIVETHKEALEKAYQYLNDDKAVCVFPEGTYHKEKGQLLPFKMGAVKMARKSIHLPKTSTTPP